MFWRRLYIDNPFHIKSTGTDPHKYLNKNGGIKNIEQAIQADRTNLDRDGRNALDQVKAKHGL